MSATAIAAAPAVAYKVVVRRRTFAWAHDVASSVAHEDELGLLDWSTVATVARVVRYDARGHGTAEPQYVEGAYRWSALVDDMVWAAPEGPFVAGGAGMGAATALWAALRAPRRVQGLVLAWPPPAWEGRQPQARALLAAARLVETRGLPAYVRSLRGRVEARVLADGLPGAGEVSVRHLRRMDEKALTAILRGAASSDLPTRAEVRSLCVPTLVLAWDGDPGHPLATAQALADLMVMSELHVAGDLDGVRAWPGVVADFMGGIRQWDG